MKSTLRFLVLLCLFAVALLALSGCFAQNNTVRLIYDRSGASVLPSSTAPRIVVVMFEDGRGRVDIGVHKDGSPFNPGSSVAEWASQGLADELAKLGAQVSLATSMLQARSGKPDYIVEGVVDHVWLTEKNISSYSCAVRLQTRLHREGLATVTKNFSSQQEKTGIPGARLYEETLSGTLADALSNAAAAIMGSISI